MGISSAELERYEAPPEMVPPEPAEPAPDKWTKEERAARIAFFSYKVSQTDPVLHGNSLRFGASCHPEWQADPPDHEEAVAIADELVLHWVLKARHVRPDPELVGDHLPSAQWYERFTEYLRYPAADQSFILAPFPRGLILQDARFLVAGDSDIGPGRPNRESEDPDRYRSYLCHHGFNGRKTGLWEFDRFYSEVAKMILDQAREGTLRPDLHRALGAVIRVHSQINEPVPGHVLKALGLETNEREPSVTAA